MAIFDAQLWRTRLSEAWRLSLRQQDGRFFLWLPVAFGLGAAGYLVLPLEPESVRVAAFVAGCAATLWLVRRMALPDVVVRVAILLFVLALGAGVAKLRTENVRAPVLEPGRTQYWVEALVVDNISPDAETSRLMLAPLRVSGLTPEKTPIRLRVSFRAGEVERAGIKPGDSIRFFAILNPPPPPSIPGGYDFARTAWYAGIGGVGIAPGSVQKTDYVPDGWRLKTLLDINRTRWNITEKLTGVIGEKTGTGHRLGGFGAALVTGHMAFIPETLVDAMRDSGLAHILSISGVHMAIVGGFAFFFLRAVMAAIPALALRVPVKKVAAAMAIGCVLIYLAISGAPAPAVRAAVVAVCAFTAILLDRRALSLRALAVAAFIVMCLTPEAVLHPGFQMSFCATAALLALAEAWPAAVREINAPLWVRAIQTTGRTVWLSLVASTVATAATTPFAIAYFNRVAMYGLLSNLLEAPVTGLVIMPFLALGSVLAATPLGELCLHIAGIGLWVVDHIAVWTAGLPGAVQYWPSPPGFVLVLSFLGLIFVCLVRGKGRWLGLSLALCILWWPRPVAPDIWVDPVAGQAAIKVGTDSIAVRDRVRQFGYVMWRNRYGLDELQPEKRSEFYRCKGYGCVPTELAPHKVGFWFSNVPPKPARLTELCENSSLIILRSPASEWPAACDGVNRITAENMQALGALELFRRGDQWHIRAAQPLRGKRYWSTPSVADATQ